MILLYIFIGYLLISFIIELISKYIAKKRYNLALNKALKALQGLDKEKIRAIKEDYILMESHYKKRKEEFNIYTESLIKIK